ncbi:hypothetical protein FOL46_007255 [Perkinsus olseni]|uniref:Uncharacterized protein n=1 Tax=Perkinsus olseni TaxID=32597 RepID=A0A7J6LF21_PEROL|nr:hypothetical protein FOL46_007255 [Perkinsus olseni]
MTSSLDDEWESKYKILNKLYSDAGNHEDIVALVRDLSNVDKYGIKKLHSKWLDREWCGMNVSSSANFNKLKYVMEHEWQDVVDLDKYATDENAVNRITHFGRIRSVGCNGTFKEDEVKWLYDKLDHLCEDIRKDTRVGSCANAGMMYSKDLQDASLLLSFGRQQEYKPWELQIDADEVERWWSIDKMVGGY